MEAESSIATAISISVIVLLAIISTILLVRFNVYVNTWYKIYILQWLLSDTGMLRMHRFIAATKRNLCMHRSIKGKIK